MYRRIWTVLRTGLHAWWGSGNWPAAPLVMHGSVAAVLCGLVGNELTPFSYALFALSISAALIALPLLGDFAALLRADPAADWIEAQPVRRSELRIARTLVLATLVGALVSAAMLPAAFFAPDAVGLGGRVALFLLGWVQAGVMAAGLLGLQSLLGNRGESLLVLAQTLLVGAVVIGLVAGLRLVPLLTKLEAPSRVLLAYPPAWFARWLIPDVPLGAAWSLAAPLAALAAVAVLIFAPLPPAQRARRGAGFVAALLGPVRAAATRWWVRPGPERGIFELVFDALPLEREFVLRSYPMLGIPLAFLLAGARGDSGQARDGLLALLLFTPGIYLPVLIVHVQSTQSPAARWLIDTAPVSAAAIASGAIKAIAVRFLLPLYVLLAALAWTLADLGFVLRIALPGAAVTLIITRVQYRNMVAGPPLSVAPDDIGTPPQLTEKMLALAMLLTLASIAAWLGIPSPAWGIAIAVALFAGDALWSRSAR